jgi:hypothetical protein
MFAVIELRRGDIAQTWAVCEQYNDACHKLSSLMAIISIPTSWWKIVEFNTNAIAPFYIVINVEWDSDNMVNVLGCYQMLNMIPNNYRNSNCYWIDWVA